MAGHDDQSRKRLGEPEDSPIRTLVYAGARFVAGLLIVGSTFLAFELAVNMIPNMDSGLRWGLFGLMILIFIVSLMMLCAPTKRKKIAP
jgi:hypothetical protein